MKIDRVIGIDSEYLVLGGMPPELLSKVSPSLFIYLGLPG